MALIKCPECGKKLSVYTKRCSECGAEVVVCSECGSVYPRGTEICDMCGRELGKRRRRSRGAKAATAETIAPNDLVSVINDVKRRRVGYKVVQALRIITGLLFWIIFALSVLLALLFSGIITNSAIALLSGSSFGEMLEQLLDTVPKNIDIWWSFIKNILTPDTTADSIINFFNYIISACALPLTVAAVYYIFVYLPLDIIETIVCGIYVKKQGYSSFDTVAVLECPSLIYNSADSFDKAYTYFPFLGDGQGALASVVSDLLYYLMNASYLLFGLLVVGIHGVAEIVVRTLLTALLGYDAAVLLTVTVIFAVLMFMLWVIVASITVGAIVKAIRGNQLKKWAHIYQAESEK